jgi:hypothetical protein
MNKSKKIKSLFFALLFLAGIVFSSCEGNKRCPAYDSVKGSVITNIIK